MTPSTPPPALALVRADLIPLVPAVRLVSNKGRQYVFYDPRLSRFRYSFECGSPGEVLKWIAHLSEKSWVTKAHIEQFVLLAISQFGIPR